MVPNLSEFETKGWYLTEQGLELLKSKVDDENATMDDYIEHAKDIDLRLLSTKGFPKTEDNEFPHGVVLQVLEITNVSMPSVHQVENPRWLRIVFTDGKRKYKAIEMKKLDCIRLHTPPGTKYVVMKSIPIRDHILMLDQGMLKELGGHVIELVQAWRSGKQFIKRVSNQQTNQEGPPPFVPFNPKNEPKKAIPDSRNQNKPKVEDENKSGKNNASKKKSNKRDENRANKKKQPASENVETKEKQRGEKQQKPKMDEKSKQDKSKQDKPKQDKSKQQQKDQDKPKQNKPMQDKPMQDKPRKERPRKQRSDDNKQKLKDESNNNSGKQVSKESKDKHNKSRENKKQPKQQQQDLAEPKTITDTKNNDATRNESEKKKKKPRRERKPNEQESKTDHKQNKRDGKQKTDSQAHVDPPQKKFNERPVKPDSPSEGKAGNNVSASVFVPQQQQYYYQQGYYPPQMMPNGGMPMYVYPEYMQPVYYMQEQQPYYHQEQYPSADHSQ